MTDKLQVKRPTTPPAQVTFQAADWLLCLLAAYPAANVHEAMFPLLGRLLAGFAPETIAAAVDSYILANPLPYAWPTPGALVAMCKEHEATAAAEAGDLLWNNPGRYWEAVGAELVGRDVDGRTDEIKLPGGGVLFVNW